jgi:hypothetical protein
VIGFPVPCSGAVASALRADAQATLRDRPCYGSRTTV